MAQMVPLNLKNLGVYEKALFDKTNAGINFLLAYLFSTATRREQEFAGEDDAAMVGRLF
jgi:hypothetical protein